MFFRDVVGHVDSDGYIFLTTVIFSCCVNISRHLRGAKAHGEAIISKTVFKSLALIMLYSVEECQIEEHNENTIFMLC